MSRNRYGKVNDSPLVSILVPTHNRRWLLPRTLDSLMNQSYKNIEIVLVNDFGEDVEDIADKYNVKYMSNEKNLGLAGTRNVALRNCTGDYICLCDDDDIYLPYAIEFRMYMMKQLNAEIVYTRALQDIWEKSESGYVSVHKQLYWDSQFDEDLILIQNVAPCSCPTFSRKSWEDANYWFDESLTTTEDHDFWIALSRKNKFHELKLVDCECSYRQDKSQMTGRLDFSKNWIKVFKKWRGTAKNLSWVKESQNRVLIQAGINPTDYGL